MSGIFLFGYRRFFRAGFSFEEFPFPLFAAVLLWIDFLALTDLLPLTTPGCVPGPFFPLLLFDIFFEAPRGGEEVLVDPPADFLGLDLALVVALEFADLRPVDFVTVPLGLVTF